MWHKPCRTFHPWCLCIKTRCLLDCCVTKNHSQLHLTQNLNTDGQIWTNLFITAFNNTDMTVLHKYITSQWRCVRDMASQITGNSTVVFRLNKGDIKAQHYCPFLRFSSLSSLLLLLSLSSSLLLSSSSLYHHHHHHHHYHFRAFALASRPVACFSTGWSDNGLKL